VVAVDQRGAAHVDRCPAERGDGDAQQRLARHPQDPAGRGVDVHHDAVRVAQHDALLERVQGVTREAGGLLYRRRHCGGSFGALGPGSVRVRSCGPGSGRRRTHRPVG
jgi:hypothetical protein